MHGENQLMWLKELQIAIIEQNTKKIGELLENPVEFTSFEEMKRAQYLLAEASELLHTLKDKTATTMQQLKKNIDFLKVTERKNPNRLDIRS